MKTDKAENVRKIMMGSPVTLTPDDTLDLANNVISLGRIRHIPVVENGKLVGLLSERDLNGAAANRIFGLNRKSKSALLKTESVRSIMGYWRPGLSLLYMPQSPEGLKLDHASLVYLQSLTAYFFPAVTTQLANVHCQRSRRASLFSYEFLESRYRRETLEALSTWRPPHYTAQVRLDYHVKGATEFDMLFRCCRIDSRNSSRDFSTASSPNTPISSVLPSIRAKLPAVCSGMPRPPLTARSVNFPLTRLKRNRAISAPMFWPQSTKTFQTGRHLLACAPNALISTERVKCPWRT